MRVVYSQGKWIPVQPSMTVETYQSKTYCHDAQRIRETGNYVNDISKQTTSSEFGMGYGDHRPFMGTNEELRLMTIQANQQQQMILELQKQIDNLTVIQQQQKLLEEKVKQAQVAQVSTSTIKGAVSTRVQSENADVEMISNNSRRSDSVHQCNQKRIITRSNGKDAVNAEQPRQLAEVSRQSQQTNRVRKSKVSSRKKKQVRSSKRVKSCNSAGDKDPTVHGSEKPFRCGECGVAFSRSDSLTRHQRIHSGEKPYKCQICNAAFNVKANLSHHLLIHTNEKPFVCDICQKQFRRKGNLSDHMNIHSGRKPHKCNFCKKTFRQGSKLSMHRKIHV